METGGPLVAECAGRAGAAIDWVPDREADLAPEPARALCGSCAGRADCLLWAVATDAQGYWAGTTSRDRAELRRAGAVSTAAAVELQQQVSTRLAEAAAEDLAKATHLEGEGGLRAYRRGGCRCGECRRANAENRADQRARAQARRRGQGAGPVERDRSAA